MTVRPRLRDVARPPRTPSGVTGPSPGAHDEALRVAGAPAGSSVPAPSAPERVEHPAPAPAPALAPRGAGRGGPRPERQLGREPAPPIKQPTWEWYIPIYFWLGGISAGAWLAATAEDIAGDGHRPTVRMGRHIALGALAGGTTLLIADLGRPERFLNMLRVVRARSAMSLGSWGLSAYGAAAGCAALLQLGEDGVLGHSPVLARLSSGTGGRMLHLATLPLALFVGSYTGVLLGTTSNPTWARRTRLLGPLYAASAMSSGLAAVSLALELANDGDDAARRRLARAESLALAAELALATASVRRVRTLPSARRERMTRLVRALTFGLGIVLPLALQGPRAWRAAAGAELEGDDDDALEGWRSRRPAGHRGGGGGRGRAAAARRRRARREERVSREPLGIIASALALAGSLGLRFLTTRAGYRSARTPGDTWAFTGGDATATARLVEARSTEGGGRRRTPSATRPGVPARSSHPIRGGDVVGRITIVQEDRIRVVDDDGRGYLLVVKARRAPLDRLERWRDGRTRVHVWYSGAPDLDGRVERIRAEMGRRAWWERMPAGHGTPNDRA